MRWLLSIVLIVAGVFFALLGLGIEMQVSQLRGLMASGAQAEGTITEQLGQRKSNAKFYSYRFRAGDREWTAARRDIPYSAREIPIGARVPVRYDPANPERSVTPAELEEAEGWGNRLVFPLVAVALLGWGVVRIVRRKT
ncbi:MAG TPA: DUF3592 domain-containing protein [Usitatibacter sp.]|jgi:hypothetical protein|nr:DUF3592 domain-containing protein [Usitatibacter sp.]